MASTHSADNELTSPPRVVGHATNTRTHDTRADATSERDFRGRFLSTLCRFRAARVARGLSASAHPSISAADSHALRSRPIGLGPVTETRADIGATRKDFRDYYTQRFVLRWTAGDGTRAIEDSRMPRGCTVTFERVTAACGGQSDVIRSRRRILAGMTLVACPEVHRVRRNGE